VLFDFGQTLVDSAGGFRAAEKDVQLKIFAALGLSDWDGFLATYRQIRTDCQTRCEFSRIAVWQQIYQHYEREPDGQVLKQWQKNYWQQVQDDTVAFPDTEEVLQSLARTYKLGLITNMEVPHTCENHRLSSFPCLEKFFKVSIVAGVSGVPPKPRREAFVRCLQSLAVAADEAVYVGDDWRVDICGAQNAGIQPIWIKHHSVDRNWPNVQTSVPVITSLIQLLDLESILR